MDFTNNPKVIYNIHKTLSTYGLRQHSIHYADLNFTILFCLQYCSYLLRRCGTGSIEIPGPIVLDKVIRLM